MGNIYIGDASSKARALKSCYVGDSSGKARKIISVFVGDANGKARLVWQAVKRKVMSCVGTTNLGTFVASGGDNAQIHMLPYKINDNRFLVGIELVYYGNSYSTGHSSFNVFDCRLDDNGNVLSSNCHYVVSDASNYQAFVSSVTEVDERYCAAFASTYNYTNDSSSKMIAVIDTSKTSSSAGIGYTSLSGYQATLYNLGNNNILHVTTGQYCTAANIYRFNEGSYSISGGCSGIVISDGYTSGSYSYGYGFESAILLLSNNRILVPYLAKPNYGDIIPEFVYEIYNYSFDESNNIQGMGTPSKVVKTAWQGGYNGKFITVGDDYFICVGQYETFGFHVDKNNNITVTPSVANPVDPQYSDTILSYCTRIGTTDSILASSYRGFGAIFYYDKANNKIEIVSSGNSLPHITKGCPYKESSILTLEETGDKGFRFKEYKFE